MTIREAIEHVSTVYLTLRIGIVFAVLCWSNMQSMNGCVPGVDILINPMVHAFVAGVIWFGLRALFVYLDDWVTKRIKEEKETKMKNGIDR